MKTFRNAGIAELISMAFSIITLLLLQKSSKIENLVKIGYLNWIIGGIILIIIFLGIIKIGKEYKNSLLVSMAWITTIFSLLNGLLWLPNISLSLDLVRFFQKNVLEIFLIAYIPLGFSFIKLKNKIKYSLLTGLLIIISAIISIISKTFTAWFLFENPQTLLKMLTYLGYTNFAINIITSLFLALIFFKLSKKHESQLKAKKK